VSFDGQVAVVTGAGSGLGREYALQLAARGAAVVCNDLVAERAESTAALITQRGGRAVPESSSVATWEGGEAITRRALDAFDGFDVLINNAGQLRNAAFEDLTPDDVDAVLATHLAGAFHVTQPAYRHMKAAGYGRLVFTSSSASFGAPWQANYAAAKAGILGLCNTVALEGAAHGIRANAVMPMALTGIGASDDPPYPPELMAETMRVLGPLAARMTVEHVAPTVLHLASRDCEVTGRAYSVGCGRVAEVFLGVTPGWVASGAEPAAPEEVAVHLDAIADAAGFSRPEEMLDDARVLSDHLAARRPARPRTPTDS